jgi:hypothetical protein
VAAGVHHAHLLAAVLGGGGRLERQVPLLAHRQRVHVGAQRHHGPGLPPAQDADDARVRDAGLHLEAERPELLRHPLRGAELAVAELRVLVDVASPGDDLRLDGPRRRCERGIGDFGAGGRGGERRGAYRGRTGAWGTRARRSAVYSGPGQRREAPWC